MHNLAKMTFQVKRMPKKKKKKKITENFAVRLPQSDLGKPRPVSVGRRSDIAVREIT